MTLVIIVTLVLAFHVAIVYALATKQFNALYLIGAVFAFMAPVSTAAIPNADLIKQGRVYCTILIVALGFLVYRLFRMGPSSLVFTAFITLYCMGALWSDRLIDAVMYKGLFGAVFLSGLLIANSTSSLKDLQSGIRILSFAGAAFAVFVLLELTRNPDAITWVGRLMAFGMNPNRIGQEAAGMFLLAAFIALYVPRRTWKIYGSVLAGTLALLILYSGSRGAAGMAMIGGVILVLPLVKRPGTFIVMAVLFGGVLYFGLGLIGEHTRDRLARLTFETRDRPWTAAMEMFRNAPVFGQGWAYNVGIDGSAGTRNMHSIYMQTLAELGIVGVTFMAGVLAFVGAKAVQAWRYIVQFPNEKQYGYFMLAVLLSVFAHGFIESSTFVGAALNAMLLGFAIGLVDRLPELVWQREEERTWYEEPELASYGDGGYLPAHS